MTKIPWDNLPNIKELDQLHISQSAKADSLQLTSLETENKSLIQTIYPYQTKIPTIAVCIPYVTMEPEWVEKVYVPLRSTPLNFASKKFCLSKVPSVSTARNALVGQAMDANADYILWVDTDHSFEDPTNPNGFADPNAALQVLYQTINKDNTKNDKIISCLYRAKQKVGLNYAMWMWVESHKGYSPIQEWTGNFITVDVVGLGCCLMDIRVFKDVPKPWFHWDEVTDVSEDFYFLRKAKEFGWNTKVFTEVRLSHIGKLKVRSDGSVTTAEM